MARVISVEYELRTARLRKDNKDGRGYEPMMEMGIDCGKFTKTAGKFTARKVKIPVFYI